MDQTTGLLETFKKINETLMEKIQQSFEEAASKHFPEPTGQSL
jgi:hypothetical protein